MHTGSLQNEHEAMGLMYLLQAATAAFPTGAFSHSFGFETLIADGRLTDADRLEHYGLLWLRHGVAPTDGAACALAWRAASATPFDPATLGLLDEEIGALRITRETRQASLSTGNAFLRTVSDTFPGAVLQRYGDLVASGHCRGHYAVAFGVAAASAGIRPYPALVAFLHGTFSSLVGVAARIIPLGQIATQKMIAAARPEILRCADTAMTTPIDRLGTATAAIDLASMAHENLYSRLCIS